MERMDELVEKNKKGDKRGVEKILSTTRRWMEEAKRRMNRGLSFTDKNIGLCGLRGSNTRPSDK